MSKSGGSPLRRAIHKIGGDEMMRYLPSDRNDEAWKAIEKEKDLGALEYSALKEHRMEMVQPVLTQPRLADIDVSCCKLSSDFLAKHDDLTSYAKAAQACADKEEFQNLLAQLGDYDHRSNKSKDFSCIIASSGTGKSQLAATAAKSTDKWNVVYFYTGSGHSDEIQEFYKPHVVLRDLLMEALRDFSALLPTGDHGAGTIAQYRHDHRIFQLLFKCFFLEYLTTPATVEELQNRIKRENKKLLVFLDEVPSSTSSSDGFDHVILLRNLLRAIGVSPILMSTHTGAINAVRKGGDSRMSSQRWCKVFVGLPKYQPADPKTFEANPWLLPTERPLVATMMVHDIAEKEDISAIVDHVQESLQKSKNLAWLNDPALQLCQLFRSKESPRVNDSYKHRVVGYHFGHICPKSEQTPIDVDRDESQNWIENQLVQFVDPEKEPILFLALTTWKMCQIDETSKRLFPLVSNEEMSSKKRRRLSIRGAFEASSRLFTKNIDTANDVAKKLDGDDLEVLALASITLASLQSDCGVFQCVGLSAFLANVFHFMCDQPPHEPLAMERMITTSNQIGFLLKGTTFSGVQVPTCPSAGSCFSVLCPKLPVCGQIDRPKDIERRDGQVTLKQTSGEQTTVLRVECKNLINSLTTEVFSKVIERMRVDCKVSLLFTSDINGLFSRGDAFVNFAADLALESHEVCFLVLKPNEDPYWLEAGGLTLEPKENTEYLMVLIATGAVEAKRS